MDKECEYLEGCPMFRYFKRSAQRVYTQMYCQGNYARCERRKLRVTNQPVPESLLPFGGKLWDEHRTRPPWWAN